LNRAFQQNFRNPAISLHSCNHFPFNSHRDSNTDEFSRSVGSSHDSQSRRGGEGRGDEGRGGEGRGDEGRGDEGRGGDPAWDELAPIHA